MKTKSKVFLILAATLAVGGLSGKAAQSRPSPKLADSDGMKPPANSPLSLKDGSEVVLIGQDGRILVDSGGKQVKIRIHKNLKPPAGKAPTPLTEEEVAAFQKSGRSGHEEIVNENLSDAEKIKQAERQQAELAAG